MLRWRKLKTIIRREYLSRVQTRAFWLSTILVPFGLLMFTLGPTLLARRTAGHFTVALLAFDTAVGDSVQARLEAASQPGGGRNNLVVEVERIEPRDDPAAQREELKRAVVEGRYTGVLVLPEDITSAETFDYLSENVTAVHLLSRLESVVRAAVVERRLTAAGLPAERIDELTREPGLVPVRLGASGEESRETEMQSFILSYLLMFLIFFTMMIYGMYVMRGVLEEKSSRIVEVIVANISPQELMFGKIFGVGAVGLTQYAIWVVVAMNLAVPGLIPAMAGDEQTRAMLSPALLGYFVLFFLLGYVLYSTVYAALGALFNSEEEAQQMQSIAGWMMAVPFLLMFPVMTNPDSTFAVVVSLVPFFSPMLFFLRISVLQPPLWQTLLCIVLMLATIVLVARFAAAVYRIGILMYGKRPTLREVWRLARER